MPRRKWNARERFSEQRATVLHDPKCTWPLGQPCIKFSTDGTRAGAEIAHTMGTTSEVIIAQGQAPNDDRPEPFVSDVDAEQADWEEDDDDGDYGPPKPQTTIANVEQAEAEDQEGIRNGTIIETHRYGPPVNHEHPRPYPASKCDFPED